MGGREDSGFGPQLTSALFLADWDREELQLTEFLTYREKERRRRRRYLNRRQRSPCNHLENYQYIKKENRLENSHVPRKRTIFLETEERVPSDTNG